MSITTLLAGPSARSSPHRSAAKECTEDPGVLIDSINSRIGPAGIVTETLAGTFATQASVATALLLHKICTKPGYMQLIDAASLPESRVGALTPLIDASGAAYGRWTLPEGPRYGVPGRAYGHYEQRRVELVSGGMPAL